MRRLRRAAALIGGALLVTLVALVVYLRADKTAAFYAVRGEYAGARVLERWRLGDAHCRWVELRNHRDEASPPPTCVLRRSCRRGRGSLRYVERIAPRPLWLLASRNDRFFPASSVQAL